jgi:uncharacterized protein
MFTKFWTPGEVKTRLAASLGPERSAAIHRLFVETLIDRFGSVADERVVALTPRGAGRAFADLIGPQWQVVTQAEGDLGCRMRAFFHQSLAHFDRVVLIGSDSPDLPAEHVEEAFRALESHDVVLGPTSDGGYYLVGAARQTSPIFDGIDWSTDRVWGQTIERLRATACKWQALPSWFDVDDHDGLDSLLGRLARGSNSDSRLAALHQSLQGLLSERAAM